MMFMMRQKALGYQQQLDPRHGKVDGSCTDGKGKSRGPFRKGH